MPAELPNPQPPPAPKYASRGGHKLRHALDAFALSVTGLDCADLGCSTGGFTDCLLQAGAKSVTSIDTGYGVIAYTLRRDPRVRVLERTNAVHAAPATEADKVDLVVIDLGWTPQKLCIPAALRWLRPLPAARIITLIKPHYEDSTLAKQHRGILPDADAERVTQRVLTELPALGVTVLDHVQSPIRGSNAKREGDGNLEWLALLQPITP